MFDMIIEPTVGCRGKRIAMMSNFSVYIQVVLGKSLTSQTSSQMIEGRIQDWLSLAKVKLMLEI